MFFTYEQLLFEIFYFHFYGSLELDWFLNFKVFKYLKHGALKVIKLYTTRQLSHLLIYI